MHGRVLVTNLATINQLGKCRSTGSHIRGNFVPCNTLPSVPHYSMHPQDSCHIHCKNKESQNNMHLLLDTVHSKQEAPSSLYMYTVIMHMCTPVPQGSWTGDSSVLQEVFN